MTPLRTAPLALALAAGPAAWVLTVLVGQRPALVEWVWGERLARWYAMAVGAVTGLAPFSVAEVGGAALAGALVVVVARALRAGWRAARWRGLGRAARDQLVRAAVLASVGYAVFLLVWGVNARRIPLDEHLGLPTPPSGIDELAALYEELVTQTNGLRAQMPERDGIAVPLGDTDDILTRATVLFHRASDRWPTLAGEYAAPKAVLLSRGMSALGIAGIYIPFTGEANVSVDGPAFKLAFSVCHEMAHQRGFTREDEANFIAYRVARDTGDLDFRYAASFMAQVYTASALGEVDYQRWRALRLGVSPGVLADAEAYAAWIQGTRTRASVVTRAVNDTYLRTQGSTGVQSYGEVVDLLLADRRRRLGR